MAITLSKLTTISLAILLMASLSAAIWTVRQRYRAYYDQVEINSLSYKALNAYDTGGKEALPLLQKYEQLLERNTKVSLVVPINVELVSIHLKKAELLKRAGNDSGCKAELSAANQIIGADPKFPKGSTAEEMLKMMEKSAKK